MANTFVKADRVVRTALALLEREIVLPSKVWRDAAGDFAGAAGDTISIRVPAYATSRTRDLRSATPYTVDSLSESTVALTLDTDVYKAVGITDEELTLDIESFSDQVMSPVVRSVARGVEDAVAASISGATYFTSIQLTADPYEDLIDARKALNDAQVPQSGRTLLVGSAVEAAILKSDHLAQYQMSGDDSALRDATIGRMAGFEVVSGGAGLDPDTAVAFHATAFALSMKAPAVPDGVSWGASQSAGGLSMRVIRDYDFTNIRDRLLANVYVGTGTVSDKGSFDSDGRFSPATGVLGTSFDVTGEADTELIDATANGHGLVAGDEVAFSGLVGGAGLTNGTKYFVIAAGLTADAFEVSETLAGSAVDFTTDITAGTVQENGASYFIRAVKLYI